MGSINRQLQRKKSLRQRKEAKKAVKHVQNQVGSMPKICGECGANFDDTDKEMLNQWRIAVWDDGRVELTCPNCGPTQEEIAASQGGNYENS